jgi:hypothetical protein
VIWLLSLNLNLTHTYTPKAKPNPNSTLKLKRAERVWNPNQALPLHSNHPVDLYNPLPPLKEEYTVQDQIQAIDPATFDLFSTYLYLFGNKRVKYKSSFFRVFLMSQGRRYQSGRQRGWSAQHGQSQLDGTRAIGQWVAKAALRCLSIWDDHVRGEGLVRSHAKY